MLPGIAPQHSEYEHITETSFYQLFSKKLGDETITFVIRDKKDNRTVKKVDILVHVVPPYQPENDIPTGSDDETNN